MTLFIPRYIRAAQTGALKEKIRQAEALLSPCILCLRQCRVNRNRDKKGYCGTGLKAVDADEIASVMIYLQNMGCCNINLVTPSHVVPQILKALDIAAGLGLRLPLVYNSSGYDSVETLKILKDVVDIYMPDFKFWETDAVGRYCQAKDYPDIAQKAVLEMQAQVGDLLLDEDGLAVSGLLVRHLVMPGRISDTGRILNFLKEKVSPHTHVNLMSQYRPMGEAKKFKELSLPLSPEEFRSALKLGRASGLVLAR